MSERVDQFCASLQERLNEVDEPIRIRSTSLPVAVHMAFNESGKIERMNLFSVDTRALAKAMPAGENR